MWDAYNLRMKKEVNLSQLLTAANATIVNPNISIIERLGLSAVDVGLLVFVPQVFIAKKALKWIKDKLQGNQEKERMYREIISKQQAAIRKQQEVNRKLEQRLRMAEEENRQNQEEIIRLRTQLKNLSDLIKLLKQAQSQFA